MNMSSKLIAVALLAAPWFVAPAISAPISSLSTLQNGAASSVEAVRYRGGGWRGGGRWGGGRGVGIGAGIVAGALIGGAIAGAPYGYGYGPGPYGYSGYGPGYVDDGDVDEGYVAVAPGGGGGSCAQRYRSYDPRSGTFLGFDGLRHPCP
jgi:hypothetical protein